MPTTAHCLKPYKQHTLDKRDDRTALLHKLARREVTPDLLRQTGKGVAYTPWASSYVFRRTGRHPCAGYDPSW